MTLKKKCVWTVTASVLTMSYATASPAIAQEGEQTSARGDSFKLEEIIVTARKRAESIQQVPISITALNGEDLVERGVQLINDVAQFVPNVTFDRGTSISGGNATSSIFIRGIGQGDFSNSADPGVGRYIDGVYVGRAFGSVFDAVDLDRIEILRGPQGTLFGKNTIGGAINIFSAMPTGQFGGYSQVEYGRFDEFNVRGSAQFPIVADSLAARLSISYRTRDGFTKGSADGKDYDDVNSLSGRGVFRWTPSDSIESTTIVDGSRKRENGAGLHLTHVHPTGLSARLYPGFASFITRDRYLTYQSGTGSLQATGIADPVSNFDGFGISQAFAWEFAPSIAFTSISAYRGFDSEVSVDGDGTPLTQAAVYYVTDQHQFSQELRLNGDSFGERLTWVSGLYYFREKIDERYWNRVLFGTFNINPNQTDELTAISKAAYVDATLQLTDSLSVSGGIRYSEDEKEFVGESIYYDQSVTWLAPGSRLNPDWHSWTPRASVEFKPTNALLLYASFAEGYKSGGINPALTKPDDLLAFGPEESTTFEAGVKADMFDRRLRVNTAAFTTEYTGIQQSVSLQPGQYTCPLSAPLGCGTVINDATIRIKGFEAEVFATPIEGLSINGAVGYVDAHFTKIGAILVNSGVLDFNRKLARTPEWSTNWGAQYSFPVHYGTVTLRGDYSYRTSTYMNVRNPPRAAQPAYSLVNARLSFLTSDTSWEFAIQGRNLTDELYITSALDNYERPYGSTGATFANYGEPRTWTLSVKYRFAN